MAGSRRPIWWTLALFALALLLGRFEIEREVTQRVDAGSVERLFRSRHSDVVVEGVGSVSNVLADDLEGARHQRFILRLVSGHTLLVTHKFDIAPRLDALTRGDEVAFREEYEWNERGGLVHWTHDDPEGRRLGGWLQHEGRSYR